MNIELERNPLLERAPTRRWVSIIAVVIPAAAFALVATWFIRAYVAPPTFSVPNPMMVASVAPQVPKASAPVEVRAAEPAPPVPAAESSAMRPAAAVEEAAPELPMLATLAVAPPAAELPAAEPPSAAPEAAATDGSARSAAAEEPKFEIAEPIAGPIPLPRMKPRFSVAMMTGPVPLPRPKPAEALPPPDLPDTDVHAVQ